MITYHFLKDPSDILDYGIDWSEWLVSDTISASSWAILPSEDDGLSVLESPPASFTNTATLVWVEDGIVGTTYKLTNTIVTADGRTCERSISIKIEEQ